MSVSSTGSFVKVRLWFHKRYQLTVNSIAFLPAIIVLAFLLLSSFMLSLDFSGWGKQIKSATQWLRLQDASTARSIISAIVAGIISLTVFSFSMVMILLNQAASSMSNRVLDKLIGNRFQQTVLGIYIGTIVYALFLLSTIRGIDSGIYVPALSTYLLILITVIDIFLFIYFLHYITHSVKYRVIIQRIFNDTQRAMEQDCYLQQEPCPNPSVSSVITVPATAAGIYAHFDKPALLKIAEENDLLVSLLVKPGTYVLKGIPVAGINKAADKELLEAIAATFYFPLTDAIADNYYNGFRQLMEIAIRALSPGINDPGTALISLRSLFGLMQFRMQFYPETLIRDSNRAPRIIVQQPAIEELFQQFILPIWDYGKTDRTLCKALFDLCQQLRQSGYSAVINQLLLKAAIPFDMHIQK